MDSHIDYTQSKKKIQLSNITHSVISVMYFSTPPQKNMLLNSHLCVCFCVRVCVSKTDSSEPLFLHTSPALIGFGLGTHISSVLEIHQP